MASNFKINLFSAKLSVPEDIFYVEAMDNNKLLKSALEEYNKSIGLDLLDSNFPRINDNGIKSAVALLGKGGPGKVIQFGQGATDVLKELSKAGHTNLVGVDFELPRFQLSGTEFRSMDLRKKLDYKDAEVSGVIFAAYIFKFIKPEFQFNFLNEMDRISGKNTYGYFGPFYPQQLVADGKKLFPESENPLKAFVDSKNKQGNGTWKLMRSRSLNLNAFASGIPVVNQIASGGFLHAYTKFAKAIEARSLGFAEVTKDYRVNIPNDYFVLMHK